MRSYFELSQVRSTQTMYQSETCIKLIKNTSFFLRFGVILHSLLSITINGEHRFRQDPVELACGGKTISFTKSSFLENGVRPLIDQVIFLMCSCRCPIHVSLRLRFIFNFIRTSAGVGLKTIMLCICSEIVQ